MMNEWTLDSAMPVLCARRCEGEFEIPAFRLKDLNNPKRQRPYSMKVTVDASAERMSQRLK
jgi:hypothetical protein